MVCTIFGLGEGKKLGALKRKEEWSNPIPSGGRCHEYFSLCANERQLKTTRQQRLAVSYRHFMFHFLLSLSLILSSLSLSLSLPLYYFPLICLLHQNNHDKANDLGKQQAPILPGPVILARGRTGGFSWIDELMSSIYHPYLLFPSSALLM